MPTTLPPEARRLRADLADLTDLAFADLGVVWRDVDSAEAAKTALNDILPGLVAVYGAAAGALAADWYDDLRDSRGIGRRFTAIVPEVPDAGADALAAYATGPLFAREPDFESSLTLAQGGLQRRIANVSRSTAMASTVADPSASGWQRVGEGACKQGFCDMLISRGMIYRTESTATFAAHDWCQCAAVPAWGGEPVPVKPFTPKLSQASDADKARLRDYLGDNGFSKTL